MLFGTYKVKIVIKITYKNNFQYKKDTNHIGYQKAAGAHEIVYVAFQILLISLLF